MLLCLYLSRNALQRYFCILLCVLPMWAGAQVPDTSDQEFNEILSLDINQLTVTSVTRTPEKSSNVAAAIYVITHDDLKRAGITTLPEALRMVPGVQVAQTGSHNWSVAVRGFNNQFPSQFRAFSDQFANKLQVLIDGRSIYTPVFSGVYWSTQDTLIEDIDRIEVIRGPGATLWGANAMNGVINVVTKKPVDTQGKYLSISGGSSEYLTTEGRYGNAIDENTFYRVYAKQRTRAEFETLNHQQAHDSWSTLSSGFRAETAQEDNHYTLQGDIYHNDEDFLASNLMLTPPFSRSAITHNINTGGNIVTRWDHAISDKSNTSLQVYFDNYKRESNAPNVSTTLVQEVNTLDLDFQHDFSLSSRDKVIWGGGYRYSYDYISLSPAFMSANPKENYATWNGFLQNEYAIIKDKLFFTVGSKFEYNDFAGSEIEPNMRLSWLKSDSETLWGAVSHAVSFPNRLSNSSSVIIGVFPGNPLRALRFSGNPDFVSEELTAYEIGYRIYPKPGLSLDISTFYNNYDKLATTTLGTPFIQNSVLITPALASNEGYGYTYGAEVAGNWKVTDYWQLAATYSFINLNLKTTAASLNNLSSAEDAVPQHQFSVRSSLNFPHDAQWNNMIYYVDETKGSNGGVLHLDPNIRFDTQLGWKPVHNMECTITGRNLFNAPHAEFPGSPITLVGPSFIGNVAWRF